MGEEKCLEIPEDSPILPPLLFPKTGTAISCFSLRVTKNWPLRDCVLQAGLLPEPRPLLILHPSIWGNCHTQKGSFTYILGTGSVQSPLSFLRKGKWESLERGNGPLVPWEPATAHQVSVPLPYTFAKIRGDPLLQADLISRCPKISYEVEISGCQVTQSPLI